MCLRTAIMAGLLAVLCFAPAAVAEETPEVWVGLVKADATAPDSAELEPLVPRLRKVFGYANYHLLHESDVPLDKPWEKWVLPAKEFYMKLVPMGPGEDGLQIVHVELYRDKQPLIQAKVRMRADRPVFIRGPQYKDGELIFVLKLTDA